ncbi:MAG: lytic transglycosylase domain-containing protein [Microbacteriaceae bacterium]
MRSRVGFVLLAFVASFGFLLVNVVDPYSGAVASPDFRVSQDPFVGQPVQSLEVTGDYAVAAVSRDSYTVKEKPKPPPPPPPPPVAESSNSGSGSGSQSSLPSITPDPGSAQAYAQSALAARGFGADEFSCLVALWNRESGWRVNASNPSGAYGIPQALPGSKMASAGADWETNAATQIEWGLGYIIGRYSSPCGAWAHSESNNWY